MRKTALSLLTTVITILCFNSTALAVTAWLSESRMLVEADDAISPPVMTSRAQISDHANSLETARPLRIGAAPLDSLIMAGLDDWYVLLTEDGPGYIRIGATGPLMTNSAPKVPGKDFGDGFSSVLDGPQNGAALVATSLTSITEYARNWKAQRSHMRIRTNSTTPVAYRISFVSELPANRVGANEPGIAANQYIMALAQEGPLHDLYRTTRVRYTITQAIALREKLFGIRDQSPTHLFSLHAKEASADPNVSEKLPVQHIILSDDKSRYWAFVVKCEQRDGLWVVTDVYRDPEMTEEEIAGIVRRDHEKMQNLKFDGARKQGRGKGTYI